MQEGLSMRMLVFLAIAGLMWVPNSSRSQDHDIPGAPAAIKEISDKPITHVIYSHAHKDHIGGTRSLGGKPIIIAHEETAWRLKRDNDPDRPIPTVTFKDKYA